MSPFARLMACLFAAALAWYFAKALGVPVWRTWEAGDRIDLALLAAAVVFLCTSGAEA